MNRQIGEYRVREWRMEDAPALARHADNPEIARNLTDRFPHPYGLEDAFGFISMVMTAEPVSFFAIASDEEAIGGIGLSLRDDVYRVGAELGYWLAEPWWGRGIVTAAVAAVVDYGFDELDLVRIYALPYAPNLASIRVLEKAGFEREGLIRSSVIKHGEILDQVMLARIRPA